MPGKELVCDELLLELRARIKSALPELQEVYDGVPLLPKGGLQLPYGAVRIASIGYEHDAPSALVQQYRFEIGILAKWPVERNIEQLKADMADRVVWELHRSLKFTQWGRYRRVEEIDFTEETEGGGEPTFQLAVLFVVHVSADYHLSEDVM